MIIQAYIGPFIYPYICPFIHHKKSDHVLEQDVTLAPSTRNGSFINATPFEDVEQRTAESGEPY